MGLLRSWLASLCVALMIMTVALLLIIVVGSDVGRAFISFFQGVFGSIYTLTEVVVRVTPLILAALGVSMGVRTGFFNIGAEGQIYMGAAGAAVAAAWFPDAPALLAIPAAMTIGLIAGGIWALIPGLLKARFGLSEVIITIMFNYIAINIVGILVRTVLKDPSYPLPMSPEIPEAMFLPNLLEPTRLHAGILVAIAAAIVVYIILWRTLSGFHMRAVGLNARGAACSGISVSKHIILAAVLSGGLAGLAGVSEILGVHHRLLDGISPGFGYVAIVIALLGRNRPTGIILAALGIAALQVGSMTMQRQAGVPASISWIIMGTLVLGLLARKRLFGRLLRGYEVGEDD